MRFSNSTLVGLKNYAPLVGNFAGRELKARYRGSVLGWTWSLLSPLATIVVYSLVFSVFLKVDPPVAGNGEKNFALFLFSGLVVWLLFAGMITGSMGWLAAVGDLPFSDVVDQVAAAFGNMPSASAPFSRSAFKCLRSM